MKERKETEAMGTCNSGERPVNGGTSCFAENAERMGASWLRACFEHEGEALVRKGFTLRLCGLMEMCGSFTGPMGVYKMTLAQVSFVPSVGNTPHFRGHGKLREGGGSLEAQSLGWNGEGCRSVRDVAETGAL